MAASTLGIVVALSAEARTLGPATRSKSGLASLTDGSLLAVSGMGCEAAARSARALAEAGCGALASWGLAGALDPALAPGTLVVPDTLLLEGEPTLSAAPAWRDRILRSCTTALPAVGGALLTSRQAVAGVAEKRDAFRRTGAAAVDMESYAAARTAASHGLPFLAVRVIVDAATDEVPRALIDAADARGRIAVGRLIVRMLAAPRSIALLPPLARRYRAALRSLRAAARAGLPGAGVVE